MVAAEGYVPPRKAYETEPATRLCGEDDASPRNRTLISHLRCGRSAIELERRMVPMGRVELINVLLGFTKAPC